MFLADAQAYCTGCDWKASTRNAMGIAAIHHKRTGHKVHVELSYVHIYEAIPKLKAMTPGMTP